MLDSRRLSPHKTLVLAFAIVFSFLHGGDSIALENPCPAISAAAVLSHRLQVHRERDLYFSRLRGLQFGVVQGAYRRAVDQMRQTEMVQLSLSTAASKRNETWRFIGPQPLLNEPPDFGDLTPFFPPGSPGTHFDASGRVTAIAVEPRTGDVFVGAAGGGVWLSRDRGVHFRPITDSLPTQAIGALAIDAVNTAPSTLYVATGEGNNSGDSYYGAGIFRSSDLGRHWTELAPGTFDRMSFTRLAIDSSHNPSHLFAAVSFGFSSGRADPTVYENYLAKLGLWRSTDGGLHWIHVPGKTFGCGVAGFISCPAEDVAIDPVNPKNVYVSIALTGVFRSGDGGQTWSIVNFPGLADGGGRTTLAAANSPPGTVYAMVGRSDATGYAGFFKSTDAGVTWSVKTVPSFLDPNGLEVIDGTNPGDRLFNYAQPFYDQTLLVAPSDPTGATVLFGGVGIYESTESGTNWTFLAANGGTHTDQHALASAPDNHTIYLGNDGGAYKFDLDNINSGVASFSSLNGTLQIGQIQAIAPDPSMRARLLAGFQDNGTQLFKGPKNLGWHGVDAGDGAFQRFDKINPNLAYHTSDSFLLFGFLPVGQMGRSIDGGLTFDVRQPTCSITRAMFSAGDAPNFYPPIAVDPQVSARVLFGAHFIYVSTDGMLTWHRQEAADLTSGCLDGSCALQDIEFAPSDDHRAWAVSVNDGDGFSVFNTTQANLDSGAVWSDVTNNLPFDSSATQATGIEVDPNDSQTAYLSISGFTSATGVGHFFRTNDFGASWSQADGIGGRSPLPDVPVLRLLVDKRKTHRKHVYAATDIGVFRSINGGKSWKAFNLGVIPAVSVFDIEQNDDGTIYIGTHGRGAYQLVEPHRG